MKAIKKKEKLLFFTLSLLLIVIIGGTIAYYNSKKDFENEFQVGEPGVAMEEKFNPADHWVPGEEKSKEVWFKNTGEMDMLLRFSVKVEWDSTVEHPDRDPNEVITLYWNDGKGNRIPATPSDAVPVDFQKITQDEKDYYYYTKVLKAGESTEHTLESVKFATNLSNDGHKNSDYSNTRLLVTIKGETVLAVPEAVEEWKEFPQIKADIQGDTVTWSTAN